MSERDNQLLLSDILISVDKILTYTKGMTFIDYDNDSKTKDAVERNFEIIGEASSRISNDFKALNTIVEWRIIKDFRNFIIHEYFGIDNQLVWDIVENQLPELKLQIIKLLNHK